MPTTTPRVPASVALVDMDTILWKYGMMADSSQDRWDPDDWAAGDPTALAKATILQKLDFIREDLGLRVVIVAAEAGCGNFRKTLSPAYKANRRERPDIMTELYEWGHNELNPLTISGQPLETDDILAINQDPRGSTVIVSNDKDMLTVPGWNYNPFNGALRWITPASAKLFHMYQTLTGDSTDNIRGAKGIGPKRAAQVLLTALEHLPESGGAAVPENERALWGVVNAAFLLAGQTTDDMRLAQRLTHIGYPSQCPTSFRNPRGLKALLNYVKE